MGSHLCLCKNSVDRALSSIQEPSSKVNMCETKEKKDDETKNETVCSDMSISQKKEQEDAEIEEVRRL